MRYLLIVFVLFSSFCPCNADEETDEVTLNDFVNEHPKCMKMDVVYEGCSLLLCSDGEYLFAQFNILHPAIQMRILMQGLTLYIDPTGKKKERYAIVFPSASDVQEQMIRGNFDPSRRQQSDERPDIGPLINSLQEYGAVFDTNGKTSTVNQHMYSIMMNEKKDALSYSVLIPITDMMNERKVSPTWSIGLYSEGGRDRNDGPGLENQQMNRQPKMPFDNKGESPNEMRKILSKDIEGWKKFSLEKICSLND